MHSSTTLVTVPVATLRTAALTLYLPALLPMVTGMLRAERHCVVDYLLSLPLVPGVIVPALLRLDDLWFFPVAGLVTLVVFAGLVAVLMRGSRLQAIALQAIVVTGVAAEAIGYANSLRA